MKKIFLGLTLSFIGLTIYGQGKANDSLFVVKQDFNEEKNSFYYVLILKRNGIANKIYKQYCVDFNAEFKYAYDYCDSLKCYSSYVIYDLASGAVKNILFNKKDTTFYITDTYDLKGIGDKIIKKSVSFDKKTATVRSKDDRKKSDYKIRLQRIWP